MIEFLDLPSIPNLLMPNVFYSWQNVFCFAIFMNVKFLAYKTDLTFRGIKELILYYKRCPHSLCPGPIELSRTL